MAILGRQAKGRREKHKPEVVTGDFELHFEDVINRNKFTLAAILSGGLILLAVVVPGAVYYSAADTDIVSVEVEHGSVINPERVVKTESDVTASDGGFIEFR